MPHPRERLRHHVQARLLGGEGAQLTLGPHSGPAPPDGGRPVTTESEPPTRSFGPRPPRPGPASTTTATAPTPAPASRRRIVAALAAGGAATVIVALALLVERRGPARPEAPSCPPVTAPLKADVDGDGCPSPAMWSGNVLEVAGERYQLGQPGDVVVLGDWDCDGRDTPALYRPGGAVLFFDGWAEDGRALPAASRGQQLPHGRPEVHHGRDGCDRLVVG